jgi:aminopeptidase YwaD
MKIMALAACLCIAQESFAQQMELEERMRTHVYTLAADSMEGRSTGTEGERKAIRYITSRYNEIGLTPKGTNGYEQEFTFNNGVRYSGDNALTIDDIKLTLDEEFFPIPGSGNGTLTNEKTDWTNYGIKQPDLKINDYANVKPGLFVIRLGNDSLDNPHSKLTPYSDINYKIEKAVEAGAKGILFINTNPSKQDDLKKDFTRNMTMRNIPIVFVKSDALEKHKFNFEKRKPHVVSLTTNVEPVKRTGRNVVGMIDNPNTSNVVIIGAHYDHLGHGQDGNSLHPGSGKEIHNGADDNASGTAAVIELSRMLKNSSLTNNDYVFINFSAEELGLIGSKYFVEHATVDSSRINYMINMDMIGRYRAEKGMEISGIGTSPKAFGFLNAYSFDGLKIKPGQQGTGPTDHTSFYYANIPVLNFFTGTHEDYHKPSDDADKVNFTDAAAIVRMIYSIVDSLNNDGVLPFTKTAEQNTSNAPAFKVRMGVIPDYMFEGPGMRIDGTTDAMPAQKAGLQKGDVVLEIDSYPIGDVMSYMQALAKYKKGDAVKVKFRRNDKEQTTTVQF